MDPDAPDDTERADHHDTASPADDRTPVVERPRWWWPALALVSVLGFAGRFLYLVRSHVDQTETFRQGDAFWYSTVATNLAKGRLFVNFFSGQPTADHPPITVLLLAPVAKLFDGHTFPMRVTMVVIGTLTIVVAGIAARRMAGPVAGLAAAVLVAVHPALWVNDVVIMSETPTALFAVLLIWAGVEVARRPSTKGFLLTGALVGLATLCRAELALFVPLMLWPLAWRAVDRTVRQRLVLGAGALAAALLVIAPWSIYNTTRFQVPVAISANDGVTLLGANCDPTYHGEGAGAWTIDDCIDVVLHNLDDFKPPLTDAQRRSLADHPVGPECEYDQKRPPCYDSAKVSSLMRTRALSYIRHHARDLPVVIAKRHGRLWGVYRFDQAVASGVNEGRTRAATRWGFYTTWLLIAPTLAGAFLLRRRRITVLPFAAALAVVVVTTTLFYGLTRFRVTYDVASCLLVAIVIDQLWTAWRSRSRSPSIPR